MVSHLSNLGRRGENAPVYRRAVRPLPCWPKRTPLPVPLPFGRGEGASSAARVGTGIQEQSEALQRPRPGLNSTAVLPGAG